MATSLVRLEILIPWNVVERNILTDPSVVQFISQLQNVAPFYTLLESLNAGSSSSANYIVVVTATAANVATIVALLPQAASALGVASITSYQYPVTQN